MAETLKIQANIQGFSKDKGITIFGALSLDTGVAVVAKEATFTNTAHDGFYVISSAKGQERRDLLFTVEELQQAIAAYIELDARGVLVIGDALARYNPQSKYDHDGFDEKGPKYRLSPDINSGHIAVMAIAMVAKRMVEAKPVAAGIDDVMDMYEAVGMGRAVITDDDMPSWL